MTTNNEQLGTFIAIEGGDGSGKGTQTQLLADYLRDSGCDVLQLTFPRYGNPSAYYVEQYLNGVYGGANEVHAELGSLPYALDRFAAAPEIIDHLEKPHAAVLTDRFVASNLAHQAAKLVEAGQRQAFYERTMLTEYDILGIPRPALNIVLLTEASIAQENVDKKAARSYTNLKRDIHEADATHLTNANLNYAELCRLYPEEYTAIRCITASHAQRSIEDIQAEIRDLPLVRGLIRRR